MLTGNYDGGRQCAGEIGHGSPGPNPGLEHRVDAISWDGRTEMRGCHWQTDPTHRRIPHSLHPGAPTGLGRGPVALPGKGAHHVRGLQRHYSIPEPSQSAGR